MLAPISFPRLSVLPSVQPLLRVAGWVVLAALTALLVANSVPYYARPDEMPFLAERVDLAARPAWRAAFLVHVSGGLVALVAPLALFSRRLLRRRPAVHRALGWAYVTSVLVVVVPSGMVLSPTAKGGVAGAAGFAVIGASLFATTVVGLRHVLRHDFVSHCAWMVRSYAMAATVLSFRVVYVVLGALDVPGAYETSVWASWAVGVLLAEGWIERNQQRRKS